jgi:hypothetical protein
MVVHETDNYTVTVIKSAVVRDDVVYPAFYGVMNSKTEVLEYGTTQLPDAIVACENLSRIMAARPWEIKEEPPEQLSMFPELPPPTLAS